MIMIICHADREMLDDLISWDEFVHMLEDNDNGQLASAIDKVRNSLVFRRMPLELVETAFARMHSMNVKKGESAIKQGE